MFIIIVCCDFTGLVNTLLQSPSMTAISVAIALIPVKKYR